MPHLSCPLSFAIPVFSNTGAIRRTQFEAIQRRLQTDQQFERLVKVSNAMGIAEFHCLAVIFSEFLLHVAIYGF
jgi:hypothetical protein